MNYYQEDGEGNQDCTRDLLDLHFQTEPQNVPDGMSALAAEHLPTVARASNAWPGSSESLDGPTMPRSHSVSETAAGSPVLLKETSTNKGSPLNGVKTSQIHGSGLPDEDHDGFGGSMSHNQRARSEGKLYIPVEEKMHCVTKMSKRESLKMQKKNYRSQKKQVAKELLSTLTDPSVIILADWLKVRGSLKSWTKLWCVLKPGLLILYKSEKQKSNHWVGTVLLNTCHLIERPSKKDGFCFKLFNPMDQSIWANKGPKGETIGISALVQPLPYPYLIFRAPSESAGKCWMDGLELALRCTSLLMKSMTKDKDCSITTSSTEGSESFLSPYQAENHDQLDESDCEKHFANQGLDEDYKTDKEETKSDKSESEFSQSDEEDDKLFDEYSSPVETHYMMNETEELGQQGDESQTEEVNDENKSLIWALLKQVRPGMDLSKVVLPTFILESRSFLDKLSDYYYHADFLSEAVLKEDPYTRMKSVVQWYLSGFYKKPKGLKKPYNPIIGETFRCFWRHKKSSNRTFYIAEQISHHPPVSAFYVTNRKDGFSISGSVLAKSKFYGNSLSAVLDGTAKLTFLSRGEDYLMTMPYAHCKGILIGTLTMEMGGKVTISCAKTGYRCEMEFKLKPFLGSGEASNRIVGKIKLGSDTLAVIEGHWDQEVYIKERQSEEVKLFWNPVLEMSQRLSRYTVPIELQGELESERLWKNVSIAIANGDINLATQEKYMLEERQRHEAKERKAKLEAWLPHLFERDLLTGEWVYKFADMRPWDFSNDVLQYEHDFVIQTQTRHKTPVVRTRSIASLEQSEDSQIFSKVKLCSARLKRPSMSHRHIGEESGSSTPDIETTRHDSDSSESTDVRVRKSLSATKVPILTEETLTRTTEPLCRLHHDTHNTLRAIQQQLFSIHQQQQQQQQQQHQQGGNQGFILHNGDWMMLVIILAFQIFVQWLFK